MGACATGAPLIHQWLQKGVWLILISEKFFYQTKIAGIEGNNDTYCLQKWTEKFQLAWPVSGPMELGYSNITSKWTFCWSRFTAWDSNWQCGSSQHCSYCTYYNWVLNLSQIFLWKFHLSPFSDVTNDEAELDSVIEQTINAFDKQNFITRGFLTKVPQMQYQFLVSTIQKSVKKPTLLFLNTENKIGSFWNSYH